MKMELAPPTATPTPTARSTLPRFAALLALALLVLCVLVRPKHFGDILEYTVTTVALANHATPEIQPTDVAETARLLPPLREPLALVDAGMRAGAKAPIPGLIATSHGVYAIHFFTYPALAAVPFKLLKAVHIDPFRCYLFVNGAALFVLGLALHRLFGRPGRALVGLLCFLLCGGVLYWPWSSPETFSAAGLLAGLIFYCTGMPVTGGLLAGLGATQNPPILMFCLFAPLLRASCGERSRFGPREVAGAAVCAVLAGVPAVFDLAVFGTPSIIGAVATDPRLVSAHRLFSFFFDLNQGMLIGVPAVAAALLLWRGRDAAAVRLLLAAVAFSVAMALPSLVATNWNSGGEGMMRYTLWAAMPLVFAFAWRLRAAPRWPTTLVVLVLAGQALALAHQRSYSYIQFSPLSRWVMAAAPGAYNPEPEIFFERVAHKDGVNDVDKVYAWPTAARPAKLLLNSASRTAATQLCGAVYALHAGVDAGHGWGYINGKPDCVPLEVAPSQPGLELGQGWSAPEHGGGMWDGAWSDGPRAHLQVDINPRHRPAALVLDGHYHGANRRTRVSIDGKDLGWFALDQLPALPVPATGKAASAISVDLEFDAPSTPAPGDADQRHLGFFLHRALLRQPAEDR